MVIEASKKYLPWMAVGFEDPRVAVHIQDGAEFMLANAHCFDVIIVDSSDPVGSYWGPLTLRPPFVVASTLTCSSWAPLGGGRG